MASLRTSWRLRDNEAAGPSVPVFLNGQGRYENVGVRAPMPVATPGLTPFNETLTAEFTPLIELDSSNGLSPVYRDTLIETNGGTVTNSGGEHVLSTSATTSSVAGLATKERGRYQPGIVGLPGLAVRRPTAATGDIEYIWGYFDDTDGFIYGEDATGVYVRRRVSGVDGAKVYQADWNGDDKLDGNGSSGATLDLNRHNIYRMPFLWYAGGPAEMYVQTPDLTRDNRPNYVCIHRFAPQAGEPLISNPKLPINAEVSNGGTATDAVMYVGGRHFAVVGRYRPNRRQSSETRSGVSVAANTREPLVSIRKKSDRTSTTKSVKVNSGDLVVDNDGYLVIVLGGTLTGASFGAFSGIGAAETACEVDTSATAISGGTVIGRRTVKGGSGPSPFEAADIKTLGVDIPDGTPVSLCFEDVSGATATVSGSVLTVEEEW